MNLVPVSASLLRNLFGGMSIDTLLLLVMVLSLSLSFHEYSHARMAYRLGDDTAALQGRLTMNPLAHLDPIGSLAFLIAGIGWAKPVPVNPNRFDRKYTMRQGMALTSLAGPVSNLLLAVISCFLFFLLLTFQRVTQMDNAVTDIFQNFFYLMYSGNISLALFNLLPLPPLDGYNIFSAILPQNLYLRIMRYERYFGLAFLLIFFLGRGLIIRVLGLIRIPFDFVIWQPIEWLFRNLWQLF